MSRKLDRLLGRSFNASKFKTVTKLAISRAAILRNQHQARYYYARSDVTELLNLGHHERALTRVEYVIKELNMSDALGMIEDYCHLLRERVLLIQKNKECPDELREAISSLIFASSRCGDFPELQKVREIFKSRYGAEFDARAVELRNYCGVTPKIVQKLSSRRCSLESRLKVLEEISTEMGITLLHLEEDTRVPVKEKLDIEQKQPKPMEPATSDCPTLKDDAHDLPEELNRDEKLPESVKGRKYYRDVAAAAQDAFESAAYAAEAARAAFDLSRSESQDDESDDFGGYSHGTEIASNSYMSMTSDLKSDKDAVINEEDEDSKGRMGFDKFYNVDSFGSESEEEDVTEKTGEIHFKELEESERTAVREIIPSASSSDSDCNILSMTKKLAGAHCRNDEGRIAVASDDTYNDSGKNQGNVQWQKHFDRKPSLPSNAHQNSSEHNGVDKQYPPDENIDNKHQLPAVSSMKSLDGPTKTKLTSTKDFAELLHTHQHSNIDWKKFSVRTRRVQKA